MQNADPVNLHELRPTRTGALAAQEERNSDSRVPAAAAHPYRSIARAVCHDAEWSFNEWFEKGGDEPRRRTARPYDGRRAERTLPAADPSSPVREGGMSGQPCDRCDGSGKTGPVHVSYSDRPSRWVESMPCDRCEGTGAITADKAEALKLGEALKAKRIQLGERLLDQAKRLGLSPAELSGLERGKGGLAAWHHPFATRAYLDATTEGVQQ